MDFPAKNRANPIAIVAFLFVLLGYAFWSCGSSKSADDDSHIPSDRKIDWSSAGVPGGIAQYRPGGANSRALGVNVTDYGAVGDGVTDCTSAFQSAQAACSAGSYIYIPDGTYLISGSMSSKSNITWRGHSTAGTVIKMSGSVPFIDMSGDWPGPQPTIKVTAGATKGSDTLTVNSTTGVVVGNHVLLSQLTPDYCHANSGNGWSVASWVGHGSDRLMTIMFRVTAKNDSSKTVTLDHELPIDMPSTPMLSLWSTAVCTGMGIEDVTIDFTNGTGDRMLHLVHCSGCWLYDVFLKNPYSRTIWFAECTNCTVERCYSLGNQRHMGNNSEGLDFYENCCWNLVQDNIFISCGYPMVLFSDWQGGCAGNVVAYNYQYGENQLPDSTSSGPQSMNDSHGPISMFNLWEGNYCETICGGGYWGSSCFGIFYRNRISGVTLAVPTYQDQCAILLEHWNDYYSVIGNVLGTSGSSTVYEASGTNTQDPQIYRLGYPSSGNRSYGGSASNPSNSNYLDTNVAATLTRNGNFDYVNNAVIWIDNNPVTLSSSCYLSSKPSWFGSLAWPAIGPDVSGYAQDIPAKWRWNQFETSGLVSDLFKDTP